MTARAGLIALIAAGAALAAPSPAAARKSCNGERPTITGTAQADALRGTAGEDVIRAGRGDDEITGLGGDDTVCAGPGQDVIAGEDGNDRLRMGAGDDRADGGAGDDRIHGQGGADDAAGGDGVDGCLTERNSGCEADLYLSASGTPPYTGGDGRVFVGALIIGNQGPTPALAAVAAGSLPRQAEFVPARSDPHCEELTTDQIRCVAPPVEVGQRADMAVAFRFPDCPSPGETIEFQAATEDNLTVDPFPQNNRYSITLPLERAPSCP